MGTKRIKFTKSSGNVFLDVGFPPDEAAHLLAEVDAYCRPRNTDAGAEHEAVEGIGRD